MVFVEFRRRLVPTQSDKFSIGLGECKVYEQSNHQRKITRGIH